MKNFKITLSYDGSRYHGFQIQQNAVTIQEKLEDALQAVFGQSLRVTAAGRTDAGVHALGQVVNFTVATRLPLERLPHALNANLPADIRVTAARLASAEFHACFSARSKVYRYTVDCSPFASVFCRHYAYHMPFPLDLSLMQQAAADLVGEHDFISFMASGSSVKTTERHLKHLTVHQAGQFLNITAEADGFLYNMVRIIAGTLLEVGRGKRSADLAAVLRSRARAAAGWTAPAHGLTLLQVKY